MAWICRSGPSGGRRCGFNGNQRHMSESSLLKRIDTREARLAVIGLGYVGLPLAVEFRHHSWAKDSVFYGLQERHVTLVSVDAPPLPDLFPPVAVITNPALFYLRLHGRNRQHWRCGSKQLQFDYQYSAAELAEWSQGRLPAMREACRSGVILFNNHVAGHAVRDAQAMAALLTDPPG